MSTNSLTTFLVCLFLCHAVYADSKPGEDVNHTHHSSCAIDLNGDGREDLAILAETSHGRELVVLLKTEGGYQAYPLARDVGSMRLACREGTTITQSEALGGGRKEHAVPGAYIELKQPEGASAAYCWNGTGFTEVWTSD